MDIKNFQIVPPFKDWRTGQTFFNFMEWLHMEKGYENAQSTRMADPFNISDNDLNKLYDEYVTFIKL